MHVSRSYEINSHMCCFQVIVCKSQNRQLAKILINLPENPVERKMMYRTIAHKAINIVSPTYRVTYHICIRDLLKKPEKFQRIGGSSIISVWYATPLKEQPNLTITFFFKMVPYRISSMILLNSEECAE